MPGLGPRGGPLTEPGGRAQRAPRVSVLRLGSIAAALLFSVGIAAAAAPNRCELRLLDDLGQPVEENISICRTSSSDDACTEQGPIGESEAELPSFAMAEYRFEGDRHGPVVERLSPGEDGACAVLLPRKAEVSIGFDVEKIRELTASFYRPDLDPNLIRPAERLSLESPQTLRIPAGPHLVSLSERGWAPDLHLLDAKPGSSHELRYGQREGWSVVVRTITDGDEEPVADAEVALRTLAGFDSPDAAPKAVPTSRPLSKAKSNAAGLVVFSGLRVPLAGATVKHSDFLDSSIPALSSGEGTFRVFEARLHEGGRLAIRIEQADEESGTAPVPGAPCSLFPPDVSDQALLTEDRSLLALHADRQGICRSEKVAAGRYALKVDVPGEDDAYVMQPITVLDGQTTDPVVELRPIRISGRVYRGDEGAPDYEVMFGRGEDFHGGGEVYPAGKPARTNEEGEYSLVLWAPGEYVAMVTNESSLAGLPRVLDIRDDDSIDFEVADTELRGRVIDESGAPRPDAQVHVKQAGLVRKVSLTGDASFAIPFAPENVGVAELVASEPGYHDSEPSKVRVEPGLAPDPVQLVLRHRSRREGRIELASGQPAAKAWISLHRIGPPPQYNRSIELLEADASGRIRVPTDAGALRLFFGGAGCPLGFYDLPDPKQQADLGSSAPEDEGFRIRCGEPSHLVVRLVADDPELRDRVPLILRRDGVTVPDAALAQHLRTLGLPVLTDGGGRLGLVALEPGAYEVFHGKATSALNVAANLDRALLTRVHLDARNTIEIETVVSFR